MLTIAQSKVDGIEMNDVCWWQARTYISGTTRGKHNGLFNIRIECLKMFGFAN